MRKYLTNILRCDTSSDNMKEKIDLWLYSFEKFHKTFIIIPTELYNNSFTKESRYITIISLPGFVSQENERIYYFNSTIELLYWNVLFQQLILNIDFDTIIYSMYINNKQFPLIIKRSGLWNNYRNVLVKCILEKNLILMDYLLFLI